MSPVATPFRDNPCLLDWTNGTGSDVSTGDVVQVGLRGMGVVANADIASTAVGTVDVGGSWKLPKYATSNALVQGQPVWWNASTELVYNAPAAGYYFLGYACEAASATASTCKVALAPFASEGRRYMAAAATGDTTITVADWLGGDLFITCANTAAKSILLPALASVPVNARLYVKKTSADAEIITINPDGSEQINGGATYTSIDAVSDRAEFISTGTALVLGDFTIA